MPTIPQPSDVRDDRDAADDTRKRRICRDDGMVILNARSWCYRPEQWAAYYVRSASAA